MGPTGKMDPTERRTHGTAKLTVFLLKYLKCLAIAKYRKPRVLRLCLESGKQWQ